MFELADFSFDTDKTFVSIFAKGLLRCLGTVLETFGILLQASQEEFVLIQGGVLH